MSWTRLVASSTPFITEKMPVFYAHRDNMTTLIFSHPDCLEHRPGPHHPESPERQTAVLNALKKDEFDDLLWRDAPMSTKEKALTIHTQKYVDFVERSSPKNGYVPLDGGDTIMSNGSWRGQMRCIGAACAGVDAVMRKEVDNVFCATRPCGHHAEADRAMGFCIFNQAAIAAVHARDTWGLKRVAVVDFDVHHGNGTQNSFWDHPELFYASCHQSPFYPGSGAKYETGTEHNVVNVPLSRGCDSATFRNRIKNEMLPQLRKFAPELIIISAGFDSHYKDPLGGLSLTDDDFYWITQEVMKVAEETGEGRVVSILEGGYSLDGLASGTAAHVRALMGK